MKITRSGQRPALKISDRTTKIKIYLAGKIPCITVREIFPDITVREIFPDITVREIFPDITVREVFPDITVREILPHTLVQGAFKRRKIS